MSNPAERLPDPEQNPEPALLYDEQIDEYYSDEGWFTYIATLDEFGINIEEPDVQLRRELGEAIYLGLRLHRGIIGAETAQQTAPGSLDEYIDEQKRVVRLSTESPRTFYEALHFADLLPLSPELRRLRPEIVADLIDFTHGLARLGIGRPPIQDIRPDEGTL